MKKLFLLFAVIYIAGCSTEQSINTLSSAKIVYEIDVTNYQDDLFHITVFVNNLMPENNIYNFPTTVPGTYSNLNFGRFVKEFKAYDLNEKELPTEKISTNQWEITNAEKLAKLVYKVEDTFDTEIPDQKVIPMAGTGINEDFIVLNTFAVLGYFKGLQIVPSKLKVDYKSDWTLGTSLTLDEDGYYVSENYDHLADSPILLGDLTTANTTVNNIKVGVYVYAPDTTITAEGILQMADEILQSSAEFIGYSPVTHYNYLMCFLDQQAFMENGFPGAGALEHSYSSLFVYPGFGKFVTGVKDDLAHEFLHILTPLNLHSEIIEPFNFIEPKASQHTWLYEGVTEWASDIMQLRGGIITEEEYLQRFSNKINVSEGFNPDISLVQLSEEVYNEVITTQFLNFYQKGAVTAALLDIRLLELSGGKRGLRELFIELLERYGKYKPFPEEKFFDIIVEETYPEIEEFINDYIKGTKPLRFKEYMSKLGYDYIAEKISEDETPVLGMQLGMNDKQELVLAGVTDDMRKVGMREGDVIYKVLNTEITMQTARTVLQEIKSMNVGDTVDVVVKRDEEEISANLVLKQRTEKHLFIPMVDLSAEQKKLRDAWLENL